MKVAELKELLSERGLKVSGRKAELIERLEESDEGSPAEEAEVEEANGVEKVGGLALAKYHEDGRYYTVTLKKDNGDGQIQRISRRMTWSLPSAQKMASVTRPW
eukprot:g29321.t1